MGNIVALDICMIVCRSIQGAMMLIHIIGLLCVFSIQLQTCLGQYSVEICKQWTANVPKEEIGECLTGRCVQQVDSNGGPAQFTYSYYFNVGHALCSPNSQVSWHAKNLITGIHVCHELCQSADGAVWLVGDDLVVRKIYTPEDAGAAVPGAKDAAPAEGAISGMYVHLTCAALLAIFFFLG
jgi:hypothetical protein